MVDKMLLAVELPVWLEPELEEAVDVTGYICEDDGDVEILCVVGTLDDDPESERLTVLENPVELAEVEEVAELTVDEDVESTLLEEDTELLGEFNCVVLS